MILRARCEGLATVEFHHLRFIQPGSAAMQSQARTTAAMQSQARITAAIKGRVINHQNNEPSLTQTSKIEQRKSKPASEQEGLSTKHSDLVVLSTSKGFQAKRLATPSSRHGLRRPLGEAYGLLDLDQRKNRHDVDRGVEARVDLAAGADREAISEGHSEPAINAENSASGVDPADNCAIDTGAIAYAYTDADSDTDAVTDTDTGTDTDTNADADVDVDTAADADAETDPSAESTRPSVDISHEFFPARLEEHRKALMRMARLRVRSHEWAEDAVQEALIAAYQSRGSYRGRGSVRSWLRGILDHKIHDRFRAECHYVQADWIDDDSSSAEEQLDWAARCGVMGVRANEDPMEICSRRQRLNRVAQSLSDMAPGMREAFVLQVVEDRPSLEVANRLGISENNCWIRVHRARKKLLMQRED
jgi:RNA polymerase sigma-70 factor (ECF subfamily)